MVALLELVLFVVLVGFGLWWGDQPSSASAKRAVYKVITTVKGWFRKV